MTLLNLVEVPWLAVGCPLTYWVSPSLLPYVKAPRERPLRLPPTKKCPWGTIINQNSHTRVGKNKLKPPLDIPQIEVYSSQVVPKCYNKDAINIVCNMWK